MSPRRKPPCEAFVPWLEHHVGKGCMAPCTGQDAAALKAFAHLLDVYAYGDEAGRRAAVAAMRKLVDDGMQPSVRILAKRMIPFALDWSDEDRLWALIARAPFAVTAEEIYQRTVAPHAFYPERTLTPEEEAIERLDADANPIRDRKG